MAGACGDGDAASAMARLRLHLAARPQRDRARTIRPRQRRRRGLPHEPSQRPHLVGPATAKTIPRCAGAWTTGPDQRDFPALEEFFAAGATDYFAELFIYGKEGDRSQGSGIVYSFTTDRKGGFSDDDARLLQATLPALSLAMKAHAGHVIASGLLRDLSRRGRRTAGPRRRDSARFGREASRRHLVRRHPRLHPDQRRRAGSRHRRPAQRRLRNSDRGAPPARRPGAQVHRRRHARHLLLRGDGSRRDVPSRARRRDRGDADSSTR